MSNASSTQSRPKIELVQSALAELLATASNKGFYGTATVTMSLQDGHIQHVRVATERVLK